MTESRTNLLLPERNCRFVNQVEVLRAATEHIVSGGVGNRTIVLAGAPGSGKTAAGVELAHRVRSYFADGDLYVQFPADHAVSESEVLLEVLLALGERRDDIPDRPNARQARYRALTADRSYLIFLDGVVSAQQVRALQPGSGASLLLVTESRPVTLANAARMRLYVLKPLDETAARDMLAGIVGAESMAAEPDAAAVVIALCDRLPLALSIVGAMVCRAGLRTQLPLAETVERLRDEHRRSSVLSTDMVFGAAYRYLSEPTRRCYRALGLRAHGGLVGVSALAATLDLPEYQVAESLIELADAHLVEEFVRHRYAVRELVRAHARDIDDRPGAQRLVEENRLLEYYDAGIAAADALIAPSRPWRASLFPELSRDATIFGDATQAREWLRDERRSIRAAVEYAYEAERHDLIVRWCVLLWPFQEKEKHLTDLLALHRLGIIAARNLANSAAESLLHTQLGFAHYWLHELDTAATEFTAAIEAATTSELEASALEGLGLVRLAQGRRSAALDLLRRNYDRAREIGDPRRVVLATFHLAKAEAPEQALRLLAQAAIGFAELPGDEAENAAKVQFWRGRKLMERGQFEEAAETLATAMAVMSTRNRSFDEAEICSVLGDIAGGQGDHRQARAQYERALAIYSELCFAELIAETQTKLDQLQAAP
ncbi:tetratricopeptide repeat protein [Nocardia vinacea]|uniref:tetratricopeptide repeat protein n=1 Tax=Nocardia vinacea TaxID=96468 RepID=UPI00340A47F1